MFENLFKQLMGSASANASGASSIAPRSVAQGPATRRRVRKRKASLKPEQIPVTRWALWGKEQPAGIGAKVLKGAAPATLADLDRIYRAEIKRALPEVVARMEPLVGARASGWQLRAMSTRWGSCTPATKRIRINVRLAAYPPECLDYVVVHELTHLLEPTHNARFHELVARVIPNEREIRKLLCQQPIE